MNLKYIITKEEIIWINEQFGGSLRMDAEIETALYRGKGKNVYRKVAYLWRAILVGHPFTDGNKRTALHIAVVVFERNGVKVSIRGEERLLSAIRKIAEQNIMEVNKIEEMLRYATRHKNYWKTS
jgi:death-on-curing family protein